MGRHAMKLLLDTHIWLWWINQDNQLSSKHQKIISEAEQVFVSSISCWELMMLHQRQRIDLTGSVEDWFYNALDNANIASLPVTKAIAIKSASLELYHRDPADRFIIATALINDCQLMSFDEKFLLYPELVDRLIGRVLLC
jgi:PIN domain nuclease of toxin-antitoxin system